MTKLKICGLKRLQDIEYVNECRPDYIGFVFAQSRRQVSPEQAKVLRENLNKEITPVGVFVNQDINLAAKLVNENIIDVIQLHGDESSDYILKLRTLMKRGKIIKAFRISDNTDISNISLDNADYLLFDTYSSRGYGGMGKTFNWDLISGIKYPFFLAGGVNIDNAEQAIEKLKPYAVDLSSSVETDGFKDREKILKISAKIKQINKKLEV